MVTPLAERVDRRGGNKRRLRRGEVFSKADGAERPSPTRPRRSSPHRPVAENNCLHASYHVPSPAPQLFLRFSIYQDVSGSQFLKCTYAGMRAESRRKP